MTGFVDFAYGQARLQARHGDRPDAACWRRVSGVGDLLHFLQSARASPLRPWVLHFTDRTVVHEIELSLRRQFSRHVTEVANWQPDRWRSSVRWVTRLGDLAALQHLLLGEPTPSWMTADPGLRAFAADEPAARRDALEQSDCAPLLAAWRRGRPLTEAWLGEWRKRWPPAPKLQTLALERLAGRARGGFGTLQERGGEAGRAALEAALTGEFRRNTLKPGAAFAHLGLVALDLSRLRGELVRRALFPEPVEEHP